LVALREAIVLPLELAEPLDNLPLVRDCSELQTMLLKQANQADKHAEDFNSKKEKYLSIT
jgi:hypothetical protein